jgi:hypothetical protein
VRFILADFMTGTDTQHYLTPVLRRRRMTRTLRVLPLVTEGRDSSEHFGFFPLVKLVPLHNPVCNKHGSIVRVGSLAKLERAKEHLKTRENGIAAWMKHAPLRLGRQVNANFTRYLGVLSLAGTLCGSLSNNISSLELAPGTAAAVPCAQTSQGSGGA